jgi:large subunit ribosomal protein L6
LSRIGKQPIPIPKGVEVTVAGNKVTVKGPKGTIEKSVDPSLTVKVENNEVICGGDLSNRTSKSLWGLWRVLVHNMIEGVTNGYKKSLEIQGVGYKAEIKGKDLSMAVGYSHIVNIKAPQGITFKCETPTKITIEGVDKQMVGQVTAEIRLKRCPEPYKGKGIRYTNEHVRRKVGKAAGK